MPKTEFGTFPDDLRGIWRNRELYKAFRSFWVRTCPKAVIAFIREGGLETGNKINVRSSAKMLNMSGLVENKNPLKLPPNDISKLKKMLKNGDPMQTNVKDLVKLVTEMHRLTSLRSKTMAIPPFYKSKEFKDFVKATTF
jgi:hypothetical protein